MNLNESIKKMPVWKVALCVMLVAGICVLLVEHYMVSKAFSIMNHAVSQMEKTFKEDDQELLDDYKEFDEREVYDRAYSRHASEVKQPSYCEYVIKNQKIEKWYDFPYAKHHAWVHDAISNAIAWNKKMIEEGMKEDTFDPSQCKDPTV
jgi:hypothetical protein